jgi:hypothetical protein
MPYKNKKEQQKYYQNNKNKYECKICNSALFVFIIKDIINVLIVMENHIVFIIK